MSLTERTQVLLTPEQRARLERIAERENVSLGALIRAAIDDYTLPRSRSRREALDDLFEVAAPVDDWEHMKDEIQHGALS